MFLMAASYVKLYGIRAPTPETVGISIGNKFILGVSLAGYCKNGIETPKSVIMEECMDMGRSIIDSLTSLANPWLISSLIVTSKVIASKPLPFLRPNDKAKIHLASSEEAERIKKGSGANCNEQQQQQQIGTTFMT